MITYTEVPNTVVNRLAVRKASDFTPDVRIPDISVSTGQSWILNDLPPLMVVSAVDMTNWNVAINEVAGFNPTTGVFTPTLTAFFNLRLRLYIGAYWDAISGINTVEKLQEGDFGRGSFIIALINTTNNFVIMFDEVSCYGTAPVYTGFVNPIRKSVILSDNVILRQQLTAGHNYVVRVLNKTELDYKMTPDNTVSIRQSLQFFADQLI